MNNESINYIKIILLKWAEFTSYDPEQRSFNLLSGEYDLHKCGDKIKQIQNHCDSSGVVSVLYAKLRFKEIFEKASVNFWSMIEHPKALDPYVEMWELFNSDPVKDAENILVDRFNEISYSIAKNLQIGKVDREDSLKKIYNSIGDITEGLEKLHIDQYLRSDDPIKAGKVCKDISVFNTLAECLVTLEKAEDGIYVCYISQYSTSAGYFGVFVKSNGNLYSINDRPGEKYIGQHEAQSVRNNRWTEAHAYGLFPYQMVIETLSTDRFGNNDEVEVICEKLPIADLPQEEFIHFIILLVMLRQRIESMHEENIPHMYTNAMLPCSLDTIKSDEKMFPAIKEGSMIMTETAGIDLPHYRAKDITSGELQKKYDRSNKTEQNHYTGVFTEYNQHLVDTYGKDFELNEDSLLRYNYPALEDGEHNGKLVAEFVGPKEKFELEQYRQARAQLAEYIKDKMEQEYEEFGGYKSLMNWFHDTCDRHKENIIREAVRIYKEIMIDKTMTNRPEDVYGFPVSDKVVATIKEGFFPFASVSIRHMLNEEKKKYSNYLCPVTGARASVWILIQPCTWLEMERIFGEELPSIVKGWTNGTTSIYTGNFLLDCIDPVARLKHPVQKKEKDFSIAVGFSRRGLKKLLKDHDE